MNGRIEKSVLRPMNRRGMTMLELVIAGALLGTLLTVCLNMIVATAEWRRTADQRQLAACEAENVMERLAARPWSELTPESLAAERLSDSIRKLLPGAVLKIEVSISSPERKTPAKRLTVSIRWRDRAGRLLPPVKITTWRYLRDEGRGKRGGERIYDS